MTGVHQLGSLLTGIGEVAVDDAESLNLARAVLDVAAKRKFKPNPEMLAWGNLLGVVAAIYAPRLVAFFLKQRESRVEKASVQNVNVRPETTSVVAVN